MLCFVIVCHKRGNCYFSSLYKIHYLYVRGSRPLFASCAVFILHQNSFPVPRLSDSEDCGTLCSEKHHVVLFIIQLCYVCTVWDFTSVERRHCDLAKRSVFQQFESAILWSLSLETLKFPFAGNSCGWEPLLYNTRMLVVIMSVCHVFSVHSLSASISGTTRQSSNHTEMK